ncbi:hypothetical protein [Stutzerimonas nitrititolerans]|nr:hypothetical protein [Stutzerimonas nitrititolerans]
MEILVVDRGSDETMMLGGQRSIAMWSTLSQNPQFTPDLWEARPRGECRR